MLGLLSEWAVMAPSPSSSTPGLFLNLYAPGTFTAPSVGSAGTVTLTVTTTYPLDGVVTVTVTPQRAASFALSLRIPCWSTGTTVTVNGGAVAGVVPGTYASITRAWMPG